MYLNKTAQNAVLFGMYVARSGRCTVYQASEGLGVSATFLEQIARRLRIAGVIKSVRGPGGGYELVGDPTVGDVLKACDSGNLMTRSDLSTYKASLASEKRALALFTEAIQDWMEAPLRKKLREIGMDLAQTEAQQLERADTASVN